MDVKADLAERIRATEAVRDNAHSFHYVQLQNDLAIMRALQELLAEQERRRKEEYRFFAEP